jgi:hypothetical protein
MTGFRVQFEGWNNLRFLMISQFPQNGIAEISGYLHVNRKGKLAEAAVRQWRFNDQLIMIGDVVWTPIRPG